MQFSTSSFWPCLKLVLGAHVPRHLSVKTAGLLLFSSPGRFVSQLCLSYHNNRWHLGNSVECSLCIRSLQVAPHSSVVFSSQGSPAWLRTACFGHQKTLCFHCCLVKSWKTNTGATSSGTMWRYCFLSVLKYPGSIHRWLAEISFEVSCIID